VGVFSAITPPTTKHAMGSKTARPLPTKCRRARQGKSAQLVS